LQTTGLAMVIMTIAIAAVIMTAIVHPTRLMFGT